MMIEEMDKGNLYIKMVILMKVYSHIIFRLIDINHNEIKFIFNNKVNGMMIEKMDKGNVYIKMVILMKV